MRQLILFTISLLSPIYSLAASSYQIDLIVFAHPQTAGKNLEMVPTIPFLPIAKTAIPLKTIPNKGSKHFNLLPARLSKLNNDNYLLTHKSRYQVLGQFSWLQPKNNQNTVAIPVINQKGWQVQGTVRVRESNYYSFDSDIQFSPPYDPQNTFTLTQKQRLLGNVTYYLDHAQIGMLVKIHKVS